MNADPDALFAAMRPARHLLRHGARGVAAAMALIHAHRPPPPLGVVALVLHGVGVPEHEC